MAKLDTAVKTFLEETFTDKEYLERKIEIEKISSDGANYSCAIYKGIIKSNNKKDEYIFAKIASVPEKTRFDVNCDAVYTTERFFYTRIAPAIESLQEKYNIPKENKYILPKFYGCNSKFLEETIVLEDLVAKGYNVFERFDSIDWEFASKAVEELAKFHALSFVLKRDLPDIYKEAEILLDWRKGLYLNWLQIFKPFAKNIYELVEDENLRTRLQAFAEKNLTEEAVEKFYGQGKFSMLLHGDYRSSNIMYKRNEDGKVCNLIPIDYQILHFGSPLTDLFFLIYNGADEDFRRQHLQDVLDHYYTTLSSWLNMLHFDSSSIYSREDFREDYLNMLPFALFSATFHLPVVLVDAKEAPKLDDKKSKLSDFHIKISKRFKERYIPILNEFAEKGVL